MVPMAEASATEEPVIPEMIMLDSTVTCASPPRTKPTTALANPVSAREIPPPDMRLPASMKKGMAIRMNESAAVTTRWIMTISGIPWYASAISDEISRLKEIGTFSVSSRTKLMNSTAVIMAGYLAFRRLHEVHHEIQQHDENRKREGEVQQGDRDVQGSRGLIERDAQDLRGDDQHDDEKNRQDARDDRVLPPPGRRDREKAGSGRRPCVCGRERPCWRPGTSARRTGSAPAPPTSRWGR